ncbi:MAG: translation initiation factor 2 [Beijerinckiaceae bacterium]
MHRIIVLSLAGVLLAGCATVTRGTTNQIQIVSEPSGATARTSMGHQCVTPCTLQVSRRDEFSVTFALPGYEDQTVLVKTQLAGAGAAGFAGNVVAGGVIGMGVDAAMGSTLEHVPNPVSVAMKQVATRTPASGTARGKAKRPAVTPRAAQAASS